MRAILAASVMTFCMMSVAAAGPLEDGIAAYEQQDFKTAFGLLLPLAEKGDAHAQAALGVMYAEGYYVLKNPKEAAQWFRKAIEQGNVLARANLGALYAKGEGVPRDYATALRLLRPRAEEGDAKAQYMLGVIYADRYNDWQRKQFGGLIATKPLEGFRSQDEDGALAVHWFHKAAEQGHVEAQNTLGRRYYGGGGVPLDYVKAAEWFHKAADQGSSEAQNYLASLYSEIGAAYRIGQSMPKDFVLAFERYQQLTQTSNNVGAQNNLGRIYTGGGKFTEAARWFRMAAEGGYKPAQITLGLAYAGGKGVERDNVEAGRWFRMAAEQGDAEAQDNLGAMYAEGKGVPLDFVLAYMWFNLGAAGAGDHGLRAAKNRDSIAAKMTPAQIAEAQRLAREWKPTRSAK